MTPTPRTPLEKLHAKASAEGENILGSSEGEMRGFIPNDADWIVTCYRGQEIMVQTWHRGLASRDIEVSAGKTCVTRGELTRVEVYHRFPPYERYDA